MHLLLTVSLVLVASAIPFAAVGGYRVFEDGYPRWHSAFGLSHLNYALFCILTLVLIVVSQRLQNGLIEQLAICTLWLTRILARWRFLEELLQSIQCGTWNTVALRIIHLVQIPLVVATQITFDTMLQSSAMDIPLFLTTGFWTWQCIGLFALYYRNTDLKTHPRWRLHVFLCAKVQSLTVLVFIAGAKPNLKVIYHGLLVELVLDYIFELFSKKEWIKVGMSV